MRLRFRYGCAIPGDARPAAHPAWMMAMSGRLSQRNLVALILAVCGDKTIEQPPRYLSWLVQRWQALPDIPPVEYWDRWQMLAQLPLRHWMGQGRYLWRQIAQRNRDLLPFDMDLILGEAFSSPLPDDDTEPEPPAAPPSPRRMMGWMCAPAMARCPCATSGARRWINCTRSLTARPTRLG